MEEKLFYLGFSLFPGVGSVKFAKLIEKFQTARNAWNANEKDLKEILGILTGNFVTFRNTTNLEEEVRILQNKQITFLTTLDKEYPELLKQLVSPAIMKDNEESHSANVIPDLAGDQFSIDSRLRGNDGQRTLSVVHQDDNSSQTHPLISEGGKQQKFSSIEEVAQREGEGNNGTMGHFNNIKIPYVLYVKGNIAILNSKKTFGIVGTRKISGYGTEVTETFTSDLVHNGFITVSGLAFGVDAVVAMQTIQSGGKTIAVLGCGVDCCTPISNQKIYDSILETGGAIVSTFRPGEQANKGSFPARNAIIAGLSLGILVTEGAADSGALITAGYAKKFNRPVFAVPGPITSSLSKGPNSLIQKGAIAVTETQEVLDSLGIITKVKDQESKLKNVQGKTKDEQQIINLLAIEPLHFDEIVRTIGKPTKETGTLLSIMELKGLIKNNGGIYSL